MSKLLEQYLNFKRELDLIEFEPLLALCDVKRIMFDGKQVGFMLVRDDGFLDSIYVQPEFRRKGLATKAVTDYLKSGKYKIDRLGIIDNNTAAMNFWKKIFNMRIVEDYGTYKVYSVSKLC